MMPFTVEGLDLNERNHMELDLSMSLISKRGKTVLSRSIPIKGKPALRGNSVWSVAVLRLTAGLEQGDYTFKIEVEDRQSREAASAEKSVTLIKPQLAFQTVQFFYDAKYTVPSSARFSLGQSLHFRAKIVGLEDLKGMYKVIQSFSIADAKTKKVIHRHSSPPQSKNLGKPGAFWSVFGHTGMFTRPGKFLLRIQLTDQIADKMVTAELPFEILQP